MHKTVVINIVGLSSSLIGEHTPFIQSFAERGKQAIIEPVLPAVTCSAQATYLTGKYPNEHGIVANGWYFEEECEIKFWRQSNKLIHAPKVWETAKEKNPDFTCANMFWWYNMYSTVDYSVTPRPQYRADGQKIPDVYSYPADLRDGLQEKLGQFPLFSFWGPRTNIAASRWIAEASVEMDKQYDPTLTLIYLPHMDYNLQRFGPGHASIATDLQEIDEVVQQTVEYFESKGAHVILLSGYGISKVDQPIHLNRIFREKGYIKVREENALELLDPGASEVFAVADHQLAHIYINNAQLDIESLKQLIVSQPGVEKVLTKEEQKEYKLDHQRSGDLVAVADIRSWFTYYYWLDDAKAPDFARTVEIHRKPGYDPVEMFADPKKKLMMLRVIWKLIRKKLGFRTLMNIIPLDASLIGGSHGRIPEDQEEWPILISNEPDLLQEEVYAPTAVKNIMLSHLDLA